MKPAPIGNSGSEVAAPDPSIDLIGTIERLWHEEIPLSTHLGVRLERLDPHGVEVSAPLEPNRNHMGTGFAGSVLAVATLAGWATVIALLGRVGGANVVLQETKASFLEPVTGEFRVLAAAPDLAARERFLDAYRRRGRARISIAIEVLQSERTVVRAENRFVATRRIES
jgi:thioesterase domain-containing protein